MNEDNNTLLKRLEKLERGNQRLKIVVTSVFCVLIAMILLGATKWEKEIATESLNIVDENGNEVAGFIASTFGCGLNFFQPKEFGDMRLWMGMTKEGPAVSFFNSNRDKSMEMKLTRKGEPGICFFDSDGKLRILLYVLDKRPGITFFDSNQKQRITIAVVEEGPGIVLFDSNGNIIESLQ